MASVSTASSLPPEAQLVLPPVLALETVGEVVAAWNALPPAPGGNLTVDASLTHTLTTPGLQLLVSLGHAVASLHGHFFIRTNDEHYIRDAFAEAGIPFPFIFGAA